MLFLLETTPRKPRPGFPWPKQTRWLLFGVVLLLFQSAVGRSPTTASRSPTGLLQIVSLRFRNRQGLFFTPRSTGRSTFHCTVWWPSGLTENGEL